MLIPNPLGAPSTPSNLSAGSSLAPALAGTGSTVNVTLALSSGGFGLSNLFWGTTVTSRARLIPDEASLLNSTPTQVVVWPGGFAGDDYDPFTNLTYIPSHVTPNTTEASTTEWEFVNWCKSIHCTAIMQVPGEIDNASMALKIVNYTEEKLNFTPAYWEIGNEPELWKKWDISWTNWSKKGESTITPTEYTQEVQAYLRLLSKYWPNIKIIGIAATGRQNGNYPVSNWVNATVNATFNRTAPGVFNGPIEPYASNLAGVAFHNYPAGSHGVMNLTTFYATLNSSASLSARVPLIRSAIAYWANARWQEGKCTPEPSCPVVPVFVTEVGSALSNYGFGKYSVGFAGALDLAAQMTQAIRLNLTNQDLFASVFNTSNSWFDLAGAPRPDYTLYSEILPHLGNKAYNVSIGNASYSGGNSSLDAGLYAVATTDPADSNRADLMAVNLNQTTNVSFEPSLPGISAGTPAEVWEWSGNVTNAGAPSAVVSPSTPEPVAQYFPDGLPAHWVLPPQTVVMFEAFPTTGVQVRFSPSGIPTGTRWFLEVDGMLRTSNGTSDLTFFLQPGQHALASPPINITVGLERFPNERYNPFPPSELTVTSATTVPINFVLQWNLTAKAVPADEGLVVPSPGWANASEPLTLTAGPLPGFVFLRWFGYGPGSVNNVSTPEITILPTGPIGEKARFVEGLPVSFVEDGLPSGTQWSITTLGSTYTSANSTITVEERNGTFGYSVGTVPGYRSKPTNSSFDVEGAPLNVPVTFILLTPPPPKFGLTFNESGLPVGTEWSVVVRGVTNSSTGTTIGFSEPNGTYGFSVLAVPGYRSDPRNSSVDVKGTTAVAVTFVLNTPPAPQFPLTFKESGLPAGTEWEVAIPRDTNQSSNESNGTEIGFWVANGTWALSVLPVPGYRSVPRNSSVHMEGPTVVSVNFTLETPPAPQFELTFVESGLPTGTEWEVTIPRNTNLSSNETSGTMIGFRVANGTWAFSVLPVPGYRSVPRNSSVDVEGPTNVSVTFILKTPPAPQFELTFLETGLPNATEWFVTVRGLTNVTNESTDVTIGFSEPNGTWAFSVLPVPGYQSVPRNSSANVFGATTVAVTFFAKTPHGPEFSVLFVESGLPTDAWWSITIRNTTEGSAVASLQFSNLTVGSYGYVATSISGYRAIPLRSGLTVPANNLSVVSVQFERVMYLVTWEETGLGAQPNWTVDLGGDPATVRGSWSAARLPNGSFDYNVPRVGDYTPTPGSGTVSVNGQGITIYVSFTRATFPVDFVASGLPAGANWTVRFSNTALSVVEVSTTFMAPNQTYTFDVNAPSGYYATPSHGNITVNGTPMKLAIVFRLSGPGPDPPIWTLAGPALGTASALGLSALGTLILLTGLSRRRRKMPQKSPTPPAGASVNNPTSSESGNGART